MSLKGYPSRNKLHMFFRSPKDWGLEFWGTNNQTWKGFGAWGIWTEGTVGQIIRDSINAILRALIEAMGEDAVWVSDGCSIDYRMSGIFENTDRTPRVLIICSEEDADPKIYIYTNPLDDVTMDEWVKLMESRFAEHCDRKVGVKKPSSSSAVPRTPHFLEGRFTAFGRSYRNMRHSDGGRLDFLREFSDHAIKTIDVQKNKEGKGEAKGKGSWDNESGGGKSKVGEKGGKVGKGKASGQASGQAPGQASGASGQAPGQASGQASGQAPGQAPGQAQPQRTTTPFFSPAQTPGGYTGGGTGKGGTVEVVAVHRQCGETLGERSGDGRQDETNGDNLRPTPIIVRGQTIGLRAHR